MNNAKLIYRYNDKISMVRVNSTLALFLNDTLVRPLGELEEALAERCQALAQELGRHSMDAGHAEQRRAESRAVRKALGFGEDADDVSPQDLLNALARRDLLQRAEELEALAEHFLVGESHKRFIKQRAHRLRQQAKELAKCHSPKT